MVFRAPGAIGRHMGGMRTEGAVKSYFAKNKYKLGLDRVLEEHERDLEAAEEALEPEGGGQKHWGQVTKKRERGSMPCSNLCAIRSCKSARHVGNLAEQDCLRHVLNDIAIHMWTLYCAPDKRYICSSYYHVHAFCSSAEISVEA